jgi:hypothetical protein
MLCNQTPVTICHACQYQADINEYYRYWNHGVCVYKALKRAIEQPFLANELYSDPAMVILYDALNGLDCTMRLVETFDCRLNICFMAECHQYLELVGEWLHGIMNKRGQLLRSLWHSFTRNCVIAQSSRLR